MQVTKPWWDSALHKCNCCSTGVPHNNRGLSGESCYPKILQEALEAQQGINDLLRLHSYLATCFADSQTGTYSEKSSV